MGIVIRKLIIAAIGGLLNAFLLYLFYQGHLIIEEAKQIAESQSTESNFNKQQFVKDNRKIFGINEKECSDINEVYTVSPEDLGF